MPITWTCDPPEFAAYVSSVVCTGAGDFMYIAVDMRCKRVPTHSHIRDEWTREAMDAGESPTNLGLLDITFNTGVDPEYTSVIWPSDLGPWTGPSPVLTIALGQTDLDVEFSNHGRYTTHVMLMRRAVLHAAAEVPYVGEGSGPRKVEVGERSSLAQSIALEANNLHALMQDIEDMAETVTVKTADLSRIAAALEDEAVAVEALERQR